MSNRVLTGPFASLELSLIKAAADQQRHDPLTPVAILLGSNILATYLLRRIAQQGQRVANLRFYTFLDLARALGVAPSGEIEKKSMPNLGLSRMLDDLLDSGVPPVFSRVSELPGFRYALLDTFRDLRDADISPSRLASFSERIAGVFPMRREHLEALTQIFRRFREAATRFWDVDDDFRRAIRRVHKAPVILETKRLLVYGIYNVTGQQEELLRGLGDSLELTYFIPYVNESASSFAREFLQARLDELESDYLQLDPPEPTGALGQLKTRIFSFSAEEPQFGKKSNALDSDGTLALLSVPGASRVAVEVVREILQALCDGIIDGFHEVGVLLRHHRDDSPIIAEALRLRKIPYYLHGGSSFARRPIAQAVRAIASLEKESFPRGAVLRTMELIGAALPQQAAPFWDVTRWRGLTNEARFLSGVESWNEATASLVKETQRNFRLAEETAGRGDRCAENEEGMPSPARARNRWMASKGLQAGWEALRKASSDWPGQLDWRQWADFLVDRLEPILGDSEDWDALSSVLDSLSCLVSLGGEAHEGGSVSRVQVERTLLQAMEARRYREGYFQRSGVNILPITAARGLSFPLVVIPGLEEGRFPSRLRQDPLLLDVERQYMGSPSRLALKSLRGEEEKLLFDSALRSAEKRLVLITSRLDESSDREQIPSDFFLRAAAAAGGGTVGLRDLNEDRVPGFRSVSLDNPIPARDQVAVDEGEIRLRLITEHLKLRYLAREILSRIEAQLIGGPLAFDRARWKRELTEYDGRFLDPRLTQWIAAKLGPAAGQVSASRIEEYAKCPYLFYLKRGIHLEPWEELEPVRGLNSLDRGRVVHEILETFLGACGGPAFVNASIDNLEQELLAHARISLEKTRPPGMADMLWEIERNNILKTLSSWLAFEKDRASGGFTPAFMERVFGRFSGEEAVPSYIVTAGRYKFDFRGRIDRIDISGDGTRARVVDYKTGRLPRSMTKGRRTPLMGGERIQIAVYRGALTRLDGLAEIEEVEGEYLYLQTGKGITAACSYTDFELREALDRLPQMLEIVGNGIEKGIFFAQTGGTVSDLSHCKYCDYLAVCGKDRLQREERKLADPAVQELLEIRRLDAEGEDKA